MTVPTTLRFVLDSGSGVRTCAAELAGADATVADLVLAAGVAPPAVVHVDGRRVPSDHGLDEAGVVQGSTISLVAPVPRGPGAAVAAAGLRVTVVAGVGSGRATPLGAPVVVGRDGACDLVLPSATVSGAHCRLVPTSAGQVAVTDLGSTNGTWVRGHQVGRGGATASPGDLVRVGAVVLRVEGPAPQDVPHGRPAPRTAAGTVPWNRPPRPALPAATPPVALPAPRTPVSAAPPFSLAVLVAPLVLGAVMVVVLGSWRYAAFMALSPLLVLATTVSGRRRVRRERRRDDRARRAAVDALHRDLAAAAATERAARWEVLPPAAEVARRASAPSTRLWERRLGDPDALRLQVGVGAVPWTVPTDGNQRPDPDVEQVLDHWGRLARAPVEVDLTAGGVVGIVGARPRAVDLARSLVVQACVHHGPADLDLAVLVDAAHVADWDWTPWLPHVGGADGRRRTAGGDAATDLAAALRTRTEDGRPLLLVCDAPGLLTGRDADARAVLRGDAGPVAGIVLAPTADLLPAVCDTVVDVRDEDGVARVTRAADRLDLDDVLLTGWTVAQSRDVARALARREDPDTAGQGAALPRRVDLLDLLPDGLDVAAAWDRSGDSATLRTPIGVGHDGPVTLDLVNHGPHGLLGGTTGAGKSELLRSLVAGLAATHAPDVCTFVLIDYKGGAAFDACADLPHVVGLVTDLDEHLGARALRCLEAELHHRERRLRAAGVSDLAGWLRLPATDRGAPLPRLVVVIDEFATLRAELPDFVTALVGVAQRGRSLGMHLLLGTQRPAGAVDENVRANANLRIALRMTDDRDALDVVGSVEAASIPPELPGRGLLRTGPAAPVGVQTALVTGRSRGARRGITVHRPRFGPTDLPDPSPVTDDGPSDLAELVAACGRAFVASGQPTPRSPWPAPLPLALAPADLPRSDVPVPFGLLDDPDHQRQVAAGWDPSRGNLLVHGAVGSGTTTTLRSLVLGLARRHDADEVHVHVLDLDRGGLTPLAALPHCGAVVTAGEPDRRVRLEALVLAEADRRRRCGAAELQQLPLHVLVVDGLATWLDDLDDPTTYDTFEAVQRLYVDAPRLRMAVVGSVPRPGALRSAVLATTGQHLVHRLADRGDVAALGLHPTGVPDLPPGRAVRPDGSLLQVARDADVDAAVTAIADRTPPASRPPTSVAVLPSSLDPSTVREGVALGPGAWRLPIGVDAVTVAPAVWALHPGEHAVVLGPPASGRSALLAALAAAVSPQADVVVVSARDGWPQGVPVHRPDGLAAALTAAVAGERPTLVLVDDAERVPDPGPVLDEVQHASHVRVVAAARHDVVAADYGSWVRRLARSRTGLLLRPVGEVSGDLLGTRLPRRPPIAAARARGWCVSGGTSRFVQTVG